MKKTKKLLFLLSFCFFIFILFSCSQKLKIENDEQSNKILCGTWSQTSRTIMSVCLDPLDLSTYIGDVTVLNKTVIKFNDDLSFEINSNQVFEKFEKTESEAEISEKEIRASFEKSVVTKGVYSSDKTLCKFENKTAILEDGSEIPFYQYSPEKNSSIAVTYWRIEETDGEITLTLTDYYNPELIISYIKK